MSAGRHGSFVGQMPLSINPIPAAVRSQSFSGVMASNNNNNPANNRVPSQVPPSRPTDPRFRGGIETSRTPFGGGAGEVLPPPPPPPPAGLSPVAQLLPPREGPLPLHLPHDGSAVFSPKPPPPIRDAFRGNNGPPPPPPPVDNSFRALADIPDSSFRRDSFRPGGPADIMGDAGSNFLSGRGPPFPMRRGSDIPELLGSDSVFRPQHARDNAFRGGRRGSDFRGGEPFRGGPPNNDGPPFRGGLPNNDGLPFRGSGGSDYYGPPAGEFRRSPSNWERPAFSRDGLSAIPPPPIGRQGSFQHRRNDPRFANKDPPHEQQQDQRPALDGLLPDDANKPSYFGGQVNLNRKPIPINRGSSDGDVLGRTREVWQPKRPSPQSSPQHRKPSLKFFQHSPNEVPTLLAPTFASAPEIKVVAAPSDKPLLPEAMLDEQPQPLLTSALGEDLTDRAEKIVAEVCVLLDSTDLKADEGQLRKLPSKQQILQAVAKMDSKIKSFQKEIDRKKEELEDIVQDELKRLLRAKDNAIAEAKRQVKERLRMDEVKRSEVGMAKEAEIQSLIQERKLLFNAEQEKILSELEAKFKVAKEEEERKMREALNEQMITTADNFDKDIGQMRIEYDKATQIAKKTEARLAHVESDYRAKRGQAEKEEPVDPSPKLCDLVSTIIAENRRRAAEAHLHQLTFVSQDEESLTESPHSDLENVKDPTEGKTTAEWAQIAKDVTGPVDALYSEPSEAPYFAQNERTHDLIAPLVKEYIRDKHNRLTKHWTELATEYEYRRTLYSKQLQSRAHAKDKPKKSLCVPVRHSILQGGKPTQPILESAGARAASNPYRRARRGNEVRTEYEQEQIIAEIAAKEALEKRISFGGTDLPRQIGRLERKLAGEFINTFTAQRVDPVEQERELAKTNVWSDMEKAIFLDR